MYKRIKVVDSEKWLIYYDENYKFGEPPEFWTNFIEINRLNYSYYKHIDTVLTHYYDNKLQKQKPPLPMQMFVYDSTLRRMAEMLIDSGFDRTLMKLVYADELAELNNQNTSWSGPSNLKRGIIIS